MTDAADRTIHNQRPRQWVGRTMAFFFCGLWGVTGGLLYTPIITEHTLLYLALAPAALLVSCLIARSTLAQLPVLRLRLGEELENERGQTYPPSEVEQIEFGPDPVEDYVEPSLPVPCCQATIELESGRRFRLIVSATDAARLREWAAKKGVVVRDPDGYSTRRCHE
jgi:hypothetical protein